jgi:hypothetical protein
MAAAEAGDAAADAAPVSPPAGPKPLSANFAEMMAAADGNLTTAAVAETETSARDLDPRQRALHTAPGSGGGIDFHPFGEDGLTFGDVIDVINPLQHIPIVGMIYRWLTGDEISPAASLAGGFLFGGPIGLAASAVNVVVDEVSGDDIGGNVMTAMFGESPAAADGGTTLADAPERSWGVADWTPKSGQMATAEGERAPQSAAAPQPQAAVMPATTQTLVAAPIVAEEPAAAPDGEPVTLNEDQLATLLAMGNGQRTLKPLPPPGAPAKTPIADAAPASGTATAEPAAVTTTMLTNMDKYQAMLKARAAETPPPASTAGPVRIAA